MPGKRGRHPKKAGGRATAKGTRPTGHVSAQVLALFADAGDVVDDDPLEAEGFASSFQQVFRVGPELRPPLADAAEVLREAGRVGGLVGLFVAKSISVYGPRDARANATAVFDKLATRTNPPRWLTQMGNVAVGDVAMMRDQYGDGFGIYLEYRDAQSETRSIGVYIDTNLGGIVKDVIDGPPLAIVRELATAEPQIEIIDIDPAEARARVEDAFLALDEAEELEVAHEVDDLRALAEHRYSLLPAGGVVPDETQALSDEERDALIDSFVSSPHFVGLPETARDIAETICDFAEDGDGNPLRWSPVVVEIFLLDWVPNEIVATDDYYDSVPVVLRSWIRFAGERRGLDRGLIDETVASIDQWLDEYHELLADPPPGGVADQLVGALISRGIDLSDTAAVQSFIDDYYAGLAGVDVDLDLAEEGLLAQWGAFEAQLAGLLQSSLASLRGVEPPTALIEGAASIVRASVRAGASPFVDAAAIDDLDPALLDTIDDLELVSSAATAWFAGQTTLDHTDILRIVIALATDGVGTPASPEVLVGLVAGEDDSDRELIREACAEIVARWQAVGAIDAAEQLTALGQWLLPRALSRMWGTDFDEAAG